MDLADLLVSSEPEAETLLEGVRSSWPLNGKAASLTVPDASDRVRLRAVLKALEGWDIEASGVEPSHQVYGAKVSFSGSFNPRGEFHSSQLWVDCPAEYLEQVQMALQAEGFPAVVSYKDELVVSTHSVDDEDVLWMELGQIGQIGEMAPERYAQWCELCPAIEEEYDVNRLDEAGVDPAVASEWAAISTEPDEDGSSDSPLTNYPRYIIGWAGSGMDPAEAREWISAESYTFRDYDTVKEWIDAGWDAQEASAWMNMRRWSCDPDDVCELQKEGFTVKHALRIKRAGGDSYDVSSLRKMDLKPSELTAWIECGATCVQETSKFTDLGLSAQEVKRWNRAAQKGGRDKVLSASDIKAWLDRGRSIDSAESWLCLHHRFISLDMVTAWEKEGMGPSEAAEWAGADVPDLKAVKAWKAAHPRCEDASLVGELVSAGIGPDQAKLVIDRLA